MYLSILFYLTGFHRIDLYPQPFLTSPALRAPSPKEREICSESLRKDTQQLILRDANHLLTWQSPSPRERDLGRGQNKEIYQWTFFIIYLHLPRSLPFLQIIIKLFSQGLLNPHLGAGGDYLFSKSS